MKFSNNFNKFVLNELDKWPPSNELAWFFLISVSLLYYYLLEEDQAASWSYFYDVLHYVQEVFIVTEISQGPTRPVAFGVLIILPLLLENFLKGRGIIKEVGKRVLPGEFIQRFHWQFTWNNQFEILLNADGNAVPPKQIFEPNEGRGWLKLLLDR